MTPEENKKYSEGQEKRLSKRDSLFGTKFHNSWRAIVFTIKGKNIGCDEEWKIFENFKKDMLPTYQEVIPSRKK